MYEYYIQLTILLKQQLKCDLVKWTVYRTYCATYSVLVCHLYNSGVRFNTNGSINGQLWISSLIRDWGNLGDF